jgi:hypothetical protein
MCPSAWSFGDLAERLRETDSFKVAAHPKFISTTCPRFAPFNSDIRFESYAIRRAGRQRAPGESID